MINRYFREQDFIRLQNDFQFLPTIINSFRGELELSLRDNYFNLYFRGNNAAKVTFERNGRYKIFIHRKFYPNSLNNDTRFSSEISGDYRIINISSELLHALLQKKYLNEIYSKIKKENYSEELNFEQMLITDNLNRNKLIIIDRQVTDTSLNRRRMDLLALKQVQAAQYSFLILEVKMGNNPELKDKVAKQVDDYVTHITANFDDYKFCYETQYQQKRAFGIITIPQWKAIEIIPQIEGLIVVGGYSGIAREQMKILEENYPNLKIQSFTYKLEI